MSNCPSCNKSVPDGAIECPFCYVIFEKWKRKTEAKNPLIQNAKKQLPVTQVIELTAKIFLIGVGIYFVYYLFWGMDQRYILFQNSGTGEESGFSRW